MNERDVGQLALSNPKRDDLARTVPREALQARAEECRKAGLIVAARRLEQEANAN